MGCPKPRPCLPTPETRTRCNRDGWNRRGRTRSSLLLLHQPESLLECEEHSHLPPPDHAVFLVTANPQSLYPGSLNGGGYKEARADPDNPCRNNIFLRNDRNSTQILLQTWQLNATLEATQEQILSQSPTYATRFWWHL